MAQRANTPIELWPKVINLLADIKLAALATNQPDQLQNAVQIETQIMQMLQQPLQQMQGGGQPTGAGPMSVPGGQGSYPAPPNPLQQAPNPDELRRTLSVGM